MQTAQNPDVDARIRVNDLVENSTDDKFSDSYSLSIMSGYPTRFFWTHTETKGLSIGGRVETIQESQLPPNIRFEMQRYLDDIVHDWTEEHDSCQEGVSSSEAEIEISTDSGDEYYVKVWSPKLAEIRLNNMPVNLQQLPTNIFTIVKRFTPRDVEFIPKL